MDKLPQVSGKETIKALRKIGFEFIQQRGSHVKLVRKLGVHRQIVIIPLHRTIKKGTLRNGILKPINLSVRDFVKLLKK